MIEISRIKGKKYNDLDVLNIWIGTSSCELKIQHEELFIFSSHFVFRSSPIGTSVICWPIDL